MDRFGFIEHLLQVMGHDPVKVRWEILELIGAGTDTTASLLVHALYELARHPGDWWALKNEVAELNGRKPTEAEMQDMRILNAVINESKTASFLLLHLFFFHLFLYETTSAS